MALDYGLEAADATGDHVPGLQALRVLRLLRLFRCEASGACVQYVVAAAVSPQPSNGWVWLLASHPAMCMALMSEAPLQAACPAAPCARCPPKHTPRRPVACVV